MHMVSTWFLVLGVVMLAITMCFMLTERAATTVDVGDEGGVDETVDTPNTDALLRSGPPAIVASGGASGAAE